MSIPAASSAAAPVAAMQPQVRLRPAIASIILLRTAMDAAYRAPLPFLVFIAASFGADPQSAGWLAVALSMAGLVAPVVGIVERRVGRRKMTVFAAGLFVTACWVMPFAPTFAVALALCIALGVSKALFGPQVQAFVGDVVPYEKRGTAIGFIELAWALSWIVGVPVFGFMIERLTWWSPFVLMGVVGLIGLSAVLRFTITRDTASPQVQGQPATLFDWDSVRRVFRRSSAVRFLIFGLLISFTAQLATLVYAPYVVTQFALSPAQLGLASVVLGVADVAAEVATIVFVDRMGKRLAVLGTSALYALSFIVVVALSSALGPLLVALFMVFFTFEFALVASLAVATEVVPEARSAMNGFVIASHSLGRIVASLIALPLFGVGGLPVVMVVAAAFTALAVVVGWPVRVRNAPTVTAASN